MSRALKSMQGYVVLVRGLESKKEWEAAYTLVFTSKKKALRELAACRRNTSHEYRLSVVEWEASADE